MDARILDPEAKPPIPVGVGVLARWSRTGGPELAPLELTFKGEATPCWVEATVDGLHDLTWARLAKDGLPGPLAVEVNGRTYEPTSRRTEVEGAPCTGQVFYAGRSLSLSLAEAANNALIASMNGGDVRGYIKVDISVPDVMRETHG